MAEYEACIAGQLAALELEVKELDVYGDSLLIINQVKSQWKIKHANLIPYQQCLIELVERFDEVTLTHLYRDQNSFANALATLATMIDIPEGETVCPIEVTVEYFFFGFPSRA
jgi:ribonuclease HI